MRRIITWLAMCGTLQAASTGLVVVGNSSNESDAQSLSLLAKRTQSALAARGVSNVTLLSEGVSRESILQELAAKAKQTGKDDDCWVVLLGYGGRGKNREPVFQVKGRRLSAEDISGALSQIQGKKWVFIGASESGAFLSYLKSPNCSALAATAEDGEFNTPRFPEKWVDALEQTPKADFTEIAARAAEMTEKFYEEQSMVVLEHARFLDPVSGNILAAPFGARTQAAATTAATTGDRTASFDPRQIEIPDVKADQLFQTLPPTDETRALIAEAKKLDTGEFEAVLTRQEIALTVNSDRSINEESRQRTFLAKPEALHRWASRTFVHSPPALQTKIKGARLILPDGSSVVLNTKKLKSDPVSCDMPLDSMLHVEFPQAVEGSLVEISWQTDSLPNFSLPQFYREIAIQENIPVIETDLILKVPKAEAFHSVLRNSAAKPEESETAFSKVLHWKIANLPAWESLPFDPPTREAKVWLGISSFESWDTFIAWYLRISKDADAITPPIQAKADEIKATYKTRTERMKAAFEFVGAIRYVAIECGIGGVRARTPEQVLQKRYGDCKDKANLLSALLRAMDIPAGFALVNRGSSSDPDFPGWQFNHAIAFSPAAPEQGQPEGIWMDTTDTTTPFGSLPPGDVGRSALLFDKTSAAFRTVQTSVTTLIRDRWDFTQEKGRIAGHFTGLRTGIADDGVRKQLRSLSPMQRSFQIRTKLQEMLPGVDFTGLKSTNLSDLATPVALQADFAIQGQETITLPKPSFEFGTMFLMPERNRPLWINDGQPLRYERIVRYPKTAVLPSEMQSTGAGWDFSIHSEQKDQTVEVTSVCEVNEPKVKAADYPEVRRRLRLWLDANPSVNITK